MDNTNTGPSSPSNQVDRAPEQEGEVSDVQTEPQETKPGIKPGIGPEKIPGVPTEAMPEVPEAEIPAKHPKEALEVKPTKKIEELPKEKKEAVLPEVVSKEKMQADPVASMKDAINRVKSGDESYFDLTEERKAAKPEYSKQLEKAA
jgi:hypothetical protein